MDCFHLRMVEIIGTIISQRGITFIIVYNIKSGFYLEAHLSALYFLGL